MGRYYEWYEPTIPKKVKGGIKAHSKRGAFANSWWGQRWIETLEGFDIGARLARGRTYARKGQVATLDIGRGKLTSKVQGSADEPYIVSIELDTFTAKKWKKIIARLLEKPIFAARLLGNEMPPDIELVFEDEGLSLFPKNQQSLRTNCSCPDWSNPCKHIAAVFYIMAEAFDNDPFLIFKLKGMDKDKLIKQLTGKDSDYKKQKLMPEPLPEEAPGFWGQDLNFDFNINIGLPGLHAAIPKRLGLLSFWRSEKKFVPLMEKLYKKASSYAVERLEKL